MLANNHPTNPVEPATFDAFRALFDRNDLPDAEQVAARLLSGPPNLAPNLAIDVLARLGLLRRRRGLAGPAVEAFEDARRIAEAARRPLPDWFHSELSGAHMEQRDWPLALRAAEDGLGAKPVLGFTAAAALSHLGRHDAARARLREAVRALAHDPARAAPAANACAALLVADRGAASQSVAAEAAAAWPGSDAFAELRATLAFLREDWDDAASRFAGLPASGALLTRLNALLRHAPSQAGAYGPVFEAAVTAAPDSEAALFQWRDLLALTSTHDEITARFIGLQSRSPVLLPALVLQLARRMKRAELLKAFADQIEAWQGSNDVAAGEAYLGAACRFQDPGPDAIARLLAMPDLRLRLFFLLRRPQLRIVPVRDAGPAENAMLQNAGVDADAVRAFLGGLIGTPPPEWGAYLDAAAFASPDAEQIVRLDEGFTAFQDRIVRDGEFPMIDPATDGGADLFDSVKIHDRQVFSFRGTELVTFHTGGNMNFALFIHLVRQNILLPVDSRAAPSKQSFYGADIHMAEVQAVWLKRAARNHAALLQAAGQARAARGTRRRIVAIHGRAENPAHHIWNYLPPFERLALAGTIGNIGAVVPPPTHYFGPLTGLFPELGQAEMRPMAEAAAIDPCPFSPGAIALQLGGSFIPRPLMARVRRWAERRAPAATRAELGGFRRRPVVWVGLRVGDKVWVNQTAGLARLIDLVVPLYPDALFVLDGFSLPDDTRVVPDKWHAAVQAITTVAHEVQAQTAFPGAVHSLVGNRISESVLWAAAADAYFTPLGSSQHKVGWYGVAPGLVYTSPNLLKTPPARRQGSWEAEGSAVPEFLIGAVAAPGQRRGNHDYRTNLDTLDFEPHVAARRLLAILGAADPSRTAP